MNATISAAPPPWQRHLGTAVGCALLGLVVARVPFLPAPLLTVGLGVGLVGASFLLAWAADAGESVFSGGLVLTAISLVAVLPELVIEVRFAYIQRAELVTANLTGATRLLLAGAIALPLVVAFLARRAGHTGSSFELAPGRRLELGLLLVTALFATQFVARGSLSVVDGAILIGFYVLYARRVQGNPEEEAAVLGVAAGLLTLPHRYRRIAIAALIGGAGWVVITVANPFADALLATGTSVGIDPYLLIQSVVPLASEAPEYVIVAVLVANRRPAQGLALFLASSVSQCTLAMGVLPIAFLAGGGGPSLPLASHEQVELSFTITLTLYTVAALANLRPEPVDAVLVVAVLVVGFVHPTAFVHVLGSLILLVFAVDLLIDRRLGLAPAVRAVFARHPDTG